MLKPKGSAILAQYDSRLPTIEKFTDCVKDLLERLLEDQQIGFHSVTSRVKERSSLEAKISRHDRQYSELSDITDISGVRFITYLPDVIDQISEVVEAEFEIDPVNSIDKRQLLAPDRFGYLSVHYVVSLSEQRLNFPEYKLYAGLKCEIQIRSILQHAWAEIEHDLGYKSPVAIPDEIKRRFFKLAGLLEIADDEFSRLCQDLRLYENSVRTDIAIAPKELPINKTTFEMFVKTNETVKRIATAISKKSGFTLLMEYESFIDDDLVERLFFYDIKTIGVLQRALEDNEKSIIEFGAMVLQTIDEGSEGTGRIHLSIGIFHLCYLIPMLNGDFEMLKQFVRNYTSFEGRKEANKWALTLRKIFKELKTT